MLDSGYGWQRHPAVVQIQRVQEDLGAHKVPARDVDGADFLQEFMQAVAEKCKEVDHHPDWFNVRKILRCLNVSI